MSDKNSGLNGDLETTDAPVFWSAVPDDLRENLRRGGQRQHFPAGASIYARGDEGRSLFVIETGRVEISVTARNGRVSVLNHMGPGEVIGEIALLDGGPRSADVVAATDVTGIMIDRALVIATLRDNPDLTFALIGQLCQKARNASEMFETLSQTKASTRLASCLIRIGEKWGRPMQDGSIAIRQVFSQADLGEFSGLSRENVNRYLRSWAEAGLIETDPASRKMTIKDPGGLRDLND